MTRRTLLATSIALTQGCRRAGTATPVLTVLPNGDVSLVQRAFNEASGERRVITLLSPT